jgi:ABC-type nitrate/sulfonate/bicarbonate transport system substrate-binding protein
MVVSSGRPRPWGITNLETIQLSLLRGVCQTPAYVAHELGFFREEGLDSRLSVEPTAWMVPTRLATGDSQLAVIPWTRSVAAADLAVVCGSGHEEAAIVVRDGVEVSEVRRITVPLRGGMKDLTAMALVRSLGWDGAEIRRQPSGDGAIISLFGRGCDAASMVEPYATMMEDLGVGRVVRRTGDVWPGAPGCSLTTTAGFREEHPDTLTAAVRAFCRGADAVKQRPRESAEIASAYIGVAAAFIERAIRHHPPDVNAIRNREAIEGVLSLMAELGYVDEPRADFIDLSFLDEVAQVA